MSLHSSYYVSPSLSVVFCSFCPDGHLFCTKSQFQGLLSSPCMSTVDAVERKGKILLVSISSFVWVCLLINTEWLLSSLSQPMSHLLNHNSRCLDGLLNRSMAMLGNVWLIDIHLIYNMHYFHSIFVVSMLTLPPTFIMGICYGSL